MHDERFTQVQKLIALKRYEQPEDAYFEEFLDEFHRRQRQELLQRSSRSLFFERVGTWFTGTSKWNFVIAGGATYAAVALAMMVMFKGADSNTAPTPLPTTPIKHEIKKPDMLTPDMDKEPIRETY